MKYTSVHIIYNPNSTGSSDDNARELREQLTKQFPKLKILLQATKHAGHAEELAYEIAMGSKHPLIVSSSGDGGYNEVINGAMRAQSKGAHPVCAVLASGNANDHSRTLTSRPVFELVKTGRLKTMDLLSVTIKSNDKTVERYAHSYVGFGLTPVVADELNKTNLNVFKEIWIVLKTFYNYRPLRIRHQDKDVTLDSLIFANIGEMAKLLKLAKNSKPDDGLFEVVIFKHSYKSRLLQKLAIAAITGLDTPKRYDHYEFSVLNNVPMQLDGEVLDVARGSTITITSAKRILSTLID